MQEVKICNIAIGIQDEEDGWDQSDILEIVLYRVDLKLTLREWFGLKTPVPVDMTFDFNAGKVSIEEDGFSIGKDLIDFLCFAKQYA